MTSTAAEAAQTLRPVPASGDIGRARRCEPPSCRVPLVDGAPSDEDPLRDALPGPATTVRAFDRDDTLVVFAEAYENVGRGPVRTIRFATTLLGEDGTVMPMTSEGRPSSAERRASGGHALTAHIPLRDVPPGRYVLQIEVQSDARGGASASRALPIHVR